MMFVVGATQARSVADIRKIVPDHFFLVPGVGAQGGSLKDISEKGMNNYVGLLVNASRAVIYAGNDEKFADDAYVAALKLQKEMARYL